MTNADYYRAYKLARSKSAVISLKAQVEIRSLYLKASKQTAEKLRDALNPGKRELTESEWNALRYELTEPGKTITDGVTNIAMGAVGAGAGLYILINADYLKDAMPNDIAITKEGIDKLAKVQTRKAAESISTRTYGTGKAFSTRVWDAKADYENTIRKIVEGGIRIGRDPAKIAKDIQAYTADGRIGIAKRWASLERGDAAWMQRLPKNIDWRAVRLVRSELQATIQDAGKLAGQTNPGATGEYEWLLGPGLNHCSTCIEYSTMTFTKDTLPDYPHGNCGCVPQAKLRDRGTFVNDLKEWTQGDASEKTRYISDWYQTVYAPAQGR